MTKRKHFWSKVLLQGICGGIFFTIVKPDFYEVFWKSWLCWLAFSAYIRLDRWEWEAEDDQPKQ